MSTLSERLTACIDGEYGIQSVLTTVPEDLVEVLDSLEQIPLFKEKCSGKLEQVVKSVLDSPDSTESPLILEFLIHLINASPINKIRIYSSTLCGLLIDYCSNPVNKNCALVLDLFDSIAEFGLNFQQINDIYKTSIQSPDSLISLPKLFLQNINTSKSYIFQADSKYSTQADFPVANFTIQFWFQYTHTHQLPTPSSVFYLGNHEQLLSYSLENSKLSVNTYTDIATFEAFTFNPGTKYHVVLIHKQERRRSYIDLFVNAEFIQSINIQLPASKRASKLEINGTSGIYFELINFLLVREPLRYDWVLLSYYLGPQYTGTYQNRNLQRHLSEKAKVIMKLKLEESDLDNLQTPKLIQKAIVVDLNANSSDELDGIILWNPNLILSSVYSVGGFAVGLRLIEAASSLSVLVESLEFLFLLLSNDPVSNQEFEMNAGYNILATILKTKKHILDLKVLDTILKFVGYNEKAPVDSILANGLAYRILIADFDIWKPDSRDKTSGGQMKDAFKFLLFQFSVFGQDSRYHSYNLKQLAEMRIVKRFIQALKYGLFEEDLLPLVHDSMSILLQTNPSPEAIKSLSLYVIYALEVEDDSGLQRKCGLTLLEIVMSIIQDSSLNSDSHMYKIFMKTVSTKWVLLILDDSDIKVVQIALKLLRRIMQHSEKTYKSLSDTTGLALISRLLNKWSSSHELLDTLVQISVCKTAAHHHEPIIISEFLVIANNIALESSSQELLLSYIKTLDHLSSSYKSFRYSILNDLRWIRSFLLLVLRLQNESSKVAVLYTALLGKLFAEKLSTAQTKSEPVSIDSAYQKFPLMFGCIVVPELLKSNSIGGLANPAYAKLLTRYLTSKRAYSFDPHEYTQVIETLSLAFASADAAKFKSIRKDFREVFIQVFYHAIQSYKDDPEHVPDEIKACCSGFMVDRSLFVTTTMDDGDIIIFCSLLECIGIVDQGLSSLAINCIRIYLINQPDIKPLVASLTAEGEETIILSHLFTQLPSMNDEDVRLLWTKDSILRSIIDKKFDAKGRGFQKPELKPRKQELIADLLDEYHFEVTEKVDKIYNKEVQVLKKAIEQSEAKKFHRHIQDDKDDLNYFINMFNIIKSQLPVEKYKLCDTLDSTEGPNRMRKRIVPRIDPSDVEIPIQDDSESGSSEIDDGYELLAEQLDFDVSHEDKNRKILRSLYIGDKIVEMVNVTQIHGLETLESIFIVGQTHIYLVGNYFLTSDGKIVDPKDAPKKERDSFIQHITETGPENVTFEHQTESWELAKFASISKRNFLLRDVALELFFIDGSSFLVTCISRNVRDWLYNILSSRVSARFSDTLLEDSLRLASSSGTPFGAKLFSVLGSTGSSSALNQITKKWQKGEISNFYYLILVNTMAGRTFNDLTQYPVFPFVIADYESEELDLSNPSTFRDLQKPMGAQSEKRAAQFKERYEASIDMSPDTPPFHYGTHYSSAMIVASYLIRLRPFVKSYLLLQGGKFDYADRSFHSILKAWNSASRDNTTDVRELIPEFYYLPDFLVNSNNFEFGHLQDGTKVEDVALPPWAKNDPVIFVEKMRQALESDYVSEHLHEWIDLVFGYKQRGKYAVESQNVFHHLSYQGSTDLDKIKDEHDRNVIVSTIHNFGQTPVQLFHKPHPRKINLLRLHFDYQKLFELPLSIVESSETVSKIEFNFAKKQWEGRDWMHRSARQLDIQISGRNDICVNGLIFENLNVCKITSLEVLTSDQFVVGFENGALQVFRLTSNKLSGLKNAQRVNVRQPTGTPLTNSKDLEPQAVLRGHRARIQKIEVNTFYSTILSLSLDGEVKLWDTLQNRLMRDVATDSKLVAMSNETGTVAVVDTNNVLHLYTINGMSIIDHILKDECTAITFAESNLNHCPTISHYSWSHHSILAVGFHSKIVLYELKLDNVWSIEKLRDFSMFGDFNVACLSLKLNVELNGEGGFVGRGELAAGGEKKLMIWC
ncbi:hypothetical protein OGAPHI_004793 [Ogataea philodendri]|uniref:Beach-domain-containing protein n=1 Tax=Ogataea philodendri TaxID=1378263 RepID=A0A9P8P3N1_9ASCO|nr:uncharacterized protein OGAPHI_004793 [Ogataea philodendri]KAH3664079.1 hypothetical protein OGAPHI_004793 [Ogataea philodendri]